MGETFGKLKTFKRKDLSQWIKERKKEDITALKMHVLNKNFHKRNIPAKQWQYKNPVEQVTDKSK